MGRYNFRAQKVHEATSRLLATGRIDRKPSWYDVVGDIPPPHILTRTRPLEHTMEDRPRTKKASKLFRPRELKYEEDKLRRTFFQDHPWELARPRIVLEDNGINGAEQWDSIQQKGRSLNGESVVQRQMYLMDNHSLTKTQAYDVARTEFYAERLREDVERRVAREEAVHVGAFFGKNRLQIGMELEDRAFEQWKGWADAEVTAQEQRRMAGSASMAAEGASAEPEEGSVLDDPVLEGALEDSNKDGRKVIADANGALGGAVAHP